MRAVAKELGSNPIEIKKAFRQNARTYITAKITYKRKDGAEITREADFTRYSLIFTGETLPDGRKADAVYLLLNEIYREILNTAQTRPLDYDYLKELSPGAQRFYELLSFQIFGALANDRPRAKMLYSYYCTRAPQTRYFDYEHVKKQMYKIHAPHKKSGYISAVEFRETTDSEGRADWEMLYTPGRKAKAEFRAFSEPNRTLGKKRKQQAQLALPAATEPAEPPPIAIHPAVPEDDLLVTKLISFHIAETTARELVRDYRKSVDLQLRALPYRNLNKIKDLAAWLIVAIKENHQLPEAVTQAEAKREEVKKATAKKEAADARQRDEEALRATYFDYLRVRAATTEETQPAAYSAFLDDTATKRAELETNPAHKGAAKKIHLRVFDDEQSHLERFRDYFCEPTFEAWFALQQK
ncbi:MAG: hypothetical protein MSG64_18900 [Pyrinomonadaceae bacterium MAG19_C2-C3]|nr:hypothetical protein [Pyrinomonadaceae bacterium MAG19_C2-C3]